MKRRLFTLQEKQELLSNPRILKVLNSTVVFTHEFKDFAVIEHYINGKSGRMIFAEAKLPDWLNIADYAKDAIKDWKKQAELGLKPKLGRPRKQAKPNSELSYEELQAKVAYLEEESLFLKKLEALEQRAKKKGLL